MATSVKQLIKQLETIADQDQAVVFQYLLAEDTSYDQEYFAQLSDKLDDTSFGDEMSREFNSWLDEMDDELDDERWEDDNAEDDDEEDF